MLASQRLAQQCNHSTPTLTKNALCRRNKRLDKHLAESNCLLVKAVTGETCRNLLAYALNTSYFIHQERHLDYMEVLSVQIIDLLEVLLLHLPSRIALLTWVVLLWK